MAIKLRSTKDYQAAAVKMLVYGQAGAGKTSLIPTLPSPFIISAEGGLLSIADGPELPAAEIETMDDLEEVYNFLTSDEGAKFESVAIDSLSEIAEVCLSSAKATVKDPRAAYGELTDRLNRAVRLFRDLPGKHVYFTAKAERGQDADGVSFFYPSAPGNKNAQGLPYFFDLVMAARIDEDSKEHYLQAKPRGGWLAKDRSGKLAEVEPMHLGKIIEKIRKGGA